MSTTNLKETYFTFKTLSKIHGEPTLESLAKLRKQVFANAEAVPNSKYGTNGYLGLVMTDEQFSKRSTIPFTRPGAVPEIDTNGTQTQLLQRERQYQRKVAYVKEFAQMESAIFQQIRDAIDEEYIAAYLDDTTGNFTCKIPELLTYLLNTYAYISEEELEMKRAEVAATDYQPGQPMDIVLQKVNTFANLAELAQTTISEPQKIAMAKVIIVKSNAYADYITEWNRKLPQQKTWSNFMTFFRQAHKELRQSRPTLRDIDMDANVIEKDLEQTIIQLQLQSQEQILKTTLEENQKQMSRMFDQMLKKLGDSQETVQKNQKTDQQEKPRTRKPSRPFKYCSKCHKNGHSAFKFSTHNDDDCKTYP